MTTTTPPNVLARVAGAGVIGLFSLGLYFLLDNEVKMDLAILLVGATFFLMFAIGGLVIRACVKHS